MDSGRRTFLKQSFGTIGSLLFGSPIASSSPIAASGSLSVISSAIEYPSEAIYFSFATYNVLPGSKDSYSRKDLAEELASFNGDKIKLAKLVEEIENHFYVFENRRVMAKNKLGVILELCKNPVVEKEYNNNGRTNITNRGIPEDKIPKFSELPDLIAKEAEKPDDYYPNKCREALEALKEEVVKNVELSKPTFADMASARKAIQYPVYAPEKSYDETEIAVNRAKKSYTRTTNFCELIADKKSSCESKARG